jgi:5-methyltetrahydropteroyltriglutamate--homocysteine methyltransferase
MHRRSEPPFRADHVGSLLRPTALLEARERFAAGALDADGLREVEDNAIRDAVAMQEEIGLQAATDGEFRRTSWHMDFIYQLGGITKTDEQIRVRMINAEGEGAFTSAGLAVTGKVRLERPIFADAYRFLAEQTTTAVPKLTIPSPSMVHYRGGTAAIDRGVYPDVEEFWTDLSTAYADEVRALAELGCRYLQLDDTSLAYLNDPV